VSLKVPAAHEVQTPPSAPEKPGLQRQVLIAVLPAIEAGIALAGQNKHAAEPVALLNMPAGHAEHGPSFAPVYPALHSHVVLPSFEYEFSGHGIQAADHTWTSHRVKCMLLKVTK